MKRRTGMFSPKKQVGATYEQIRDTLAYLALPGGERARLAKEATAAKSGSEAPAWLSDDVIIVCHHLGYIESVPLVGRPDPGAMVSMSQDNKRLTGTVMQLTEHGRASLARMERGETMDMSHAKGEFEVSRPD